MGAQTMMERCCGTDGRPDLDEMVKYMERHDRGSKFDTAGWALFFIWLGVAWVAGLSLGVGLLGVAAITLFMQAMRVLYGLRVEMFWVLVGLGFALAGLWQWFDVQRPLAPFVLIAFGLALLFWRVLPRTSKKSASQDSGD